MVRVRRGAAGPVEDLLGRYRDHCLRSAAWPKAPCAATSTSRGPCIAAAMCCDLIDLAGVTAADMAGFVRAACPSYSIGRAKLISC